MNISGNSRVWIYQADRDFSAGEHEYLKEKLSAFINEWQAHGEKLAGAFEIRYNRFIILFVDEEVAGASGCSIDRSVNLMKTFEQELGLNLFDRFNIAYRKDKEINYCDRNAFEKLAIEGEITENTVVFNNLVQTKAELDTKWQVPAKESWHARVFSLQQEV